MLFHGNPHLVRARRQVTVNPVVRRALVNPFGTAPITFFGTNYLELVYDSFCRSKSVKSDVKVLRCQSVDRLQQYLEDLEFVLHLGSHLRERFRHHFARAAPPSEVEERQLFGRKRGTNIKCLGISREIAARSSRQPQRFKTSARDLYRDYFFWNCSSKVLTTQKQGGDGRKTTQFSAVIRRLSSTILYYVPSTILTAGG